MKQIILVEASLLPVLTFAQFSARVVNQNNQAIPFASINIKNTIKGVITDSSGRFSIVTDQSFPLSLIVSAEGHKKRELSVVTRSTAEDAETFNVNLLKALIPSVQLYSSNPRNTALNIREQGTSGNFLIKTT